MAYLNIDYHNLCLFEGNTPDEVEGTHARGGRVEIFESLKEMRIYLTKLKLTRIEKLKDVFFMKRCISTQYTMKGWGGQLRK